jgi:hypothetical protein
VLLEVSKRQPITEIPAGISLTVSSKATTMDYVLAHGEPLDSERRSPIAFRPLAFLAVRFSGEPPV